MNEVRELVRLSKYAGERFDLVQAGGGNASVKLPGGNMLIKASGCLLSEVEEGRGHVRVDNRKALSILNDPRLSAAPDKDARDRFVCQAADGMVLDKGGRPSIETFLHCLLDRYTLHTHPVSATVAACRRDWAETISKVFKNEAVLVGYATPGIELAIELKKAVGEYREAHDGSNPEIIFLQNHGLIVSSDVFETVIRKTEEVSARLEVEFGMDLSRYRLTSRVSAYVNSTDGGDRTSYISDDIVLRDAVKRDKALLFQAPFCPDKQVYCGGGVLELEGLSDMGPLSGYIKEFHEPPRVVIHKGEVFFVARNARKAKEMEDVLKFHVLVLAHAGADVNYLDAGEREYIRNWHAEIYRQNG